MMENPLPGLYFAPTANAIRVDWLRVTKHCQHKTVTSFTLSTHSVHTQQSLPVHSAHTPYTLNNHSVYTQHTLPVHSTNTLCTLNNHSLYTQHTPCILNNHSQSLYTQQTTLYTQQTLPVHTTITSCTLKNTPCTLDSHFMYT